MAEESEVSAVEVDEVEEDEGEDELSATRHAELLRELASCQKKIETLETNLQAAQRDQAAQQPELSRILAMLEELRTQNQTLTAQLASYQDSIASTQREASNQSPALQVVTVETPSSETREDGQRGAKPNSTTEQQPSTPQKKKRYVRV